VAIEGSPYTEKAKKLGANAILTKPSGSVSLNLAEKCGAEMEQTIKKAQKMTRHEWRFCLRNIRN
jgi:hypothetical protein